MVGNMSGKITSVNTEPVSDIPVSVVDPVSVVPVHATSGIDNSTPVDVDPESILSHVLVLPVSVSPVLFSIRDHVYTSPVLVDPESTIPVSVIIFPVFVSIGTTTSQFSSVDDIWMIILSFCVPLYS